MRTVERGFNALGARLESVESYTDQNCTRIGSCLQGCPTNGGKSTKNTYIAGSLADALARVAGQARVERVADRGARRRAARRPASSTATRRRAPRRGGGRRRRRRRDAQHAGLLARSGLEDPLIGRNLGFHPARLVFGRFEEPQDAHVVYPITTHYADRRRDADGGFVIEAVTMQDPIGFAVNLQDERGPMWGEPLVQALRGSATGPACSRWSTMTTTEPSSQQPAGMTMTPNLRLLGRRDRAPRRRARLSRRALEAAGAQQVRWTGLVTTHIQGSCRMGSDPARSVVDAHGEMHTVRRLFVGDGSVIPRTVSANPSLTIMALATRLADHLDADASGYLGSLQAAAA